MGQENFDGRLCRETAQKRGRTFRYLFSALRCRHFLLHHVGAARRLQDTCDSNRARPQRDDWGRPSAVRTCDSNRSPTFRFVLN